MAAQPNGSGRRKPALPATDRWLTASDVAQRLRVSPATVQRWAREGRIPHVRIGRAVRFTLDHLHMIETAHEQAVTVALSPVPSLTPNPSSVALLNTSDVATRLGISREQVWRLWSSGQLAGYRFDRRLRFAASDIDEFLERSRIDHAPRRAGKVVDLRMGRRDDAPDAPPTTEYRRI